MSKQSFEQFCRNRNSMVSGMSLIRRLELETRPRQANPSNPPTAKERSARNLRAAAGTGAAP